MNDTMSERERALLGAEGADYNTAYYEKFLEEIFNFGSVPPKKIDISDHLNITLRILMPVENIEVAKKVDQASGIVEKEQIIKHETLCRSIVKMNGQLIRFSDDMIAEWKAFRNTDKEPSDVEQQRFMLKYKFSQPLINQIYSLYVALLKEQEQFFIDLKKK